MKSVISKLQLVRLGQVDGTWNYTELHIDSMIQERKFENFEI